MSVSKGVDYGVYIDDMGSSGTVSVAFSGPKVERTLTSADNFLLNNLQIDSSNIPGLDRFSGPFTFTASSQGRMISTQTNIINSLTGRVESGSMTVMLSTPPTVDPESGTITSFGFYDAGDGTSGLTNQDQCYVYCTRQLSTWMADIVDLHPEIATKSFYNFVLPGAHDAGMCTMRTVEEVLSGRDGAAFRDAIAGVLFDVVKDVLRDLTPTIILNAAITQKDSIEDMLALGCRYFDFRPGTMYRGIGDLDGRYHQHSLVPGMSYVDFLVAVQQWLSQHPGEIVVVNCNTQGFAESSMRPSPDDLIDDWATAIGTSKVGIKTGDASSLDQSYGTLIETDVRMIFLNQIDGETTKYDSYSGAYDTLVPGPIIDALEKMCQGQQDLYTYTVLQLQGTATSVIPYSSFVTASQTASPLMSTKAWFDSQTLPWVKQYGPEKLRANKLIILLNDFIDNATADTAIGWTLRRMGTADQPSLS